MSQQPDSTLITSPLHTSPLHPRHEAAGAKFAEFGGWLMPLEYAGGGVLTEHAAVRDGVGVFDVSHLGKADVTGAGAVEFLNSVLTNDLTRIALGKAQYTMLCNDQGGVVDDLIAYLRGDEDVFLIPNAANTATVVQILTDAAPDEITIRNRHLDYAIMAVQGPKSVELVALLGLPTEMDYMGFATVDREGWTMTVCRTGYTGELGFELVVPADHALTVFDELMAAGETFGVRLCGLGARDTLRTEMGYSLHGNDISPMINPVEAGLSWAIGWSKPEFHGAQALRKIKADGPTRRMRGLKAIGRGIARHGMSVLRLDDPEQISIGEVTSGTFSPTLRQGVALALIDASVGFGDRVGVLVRNRVEEFEVVKPPFVTPEVRTA